LITNLIVQLQQTEDNRAAFPRMGVLSHHWRNIQ
jgi:hypothetical protein